MLGEIRDDICQRLSRLSIWVKSVVFGLAAPESHMLRIVPVVPIRDAI